MAQNNDAYSPILPFDITCGEHFQIYNNITYVQDKTLCGDEPIKMFSGNVLKFYTQRDIEPLKVGGDDNDSLL